MLVGMVALGGSVIGILTSVGQGVLPFEVSPLANSSGAWSLGAFLLALSNREPPRGALLGFVALATMLVGYNVATELRGFTASAGLWLFWGLAAIVIGPALGIGAAWVRGTEPIRIAAGVALIAGILIGEGLYGLTVIAATTSPGYWAGQIAVGIGIVVAMSVRRLGTLRHVALCAALTATVAGVFYVGYSGDLISLL